MSKLTIISNYHKRPLLYWHELTDKERAEFDWMDDETAHTGEFFCYKGQVYYTGNFTRIKRHTSTEGFSSWDGYSGDSFFSGVLVKYPREDWGDYDTENVIVGWYLC